MHAKNKKNVTTSVRFSDSEFEFLSSKAIEAGIGKTTMFRHIILQFFKNNNKLIS